MILTLIIHFQTIESILKLIAGTIPGEHPMNFQTIESILKLFSIIPILFHPHNFQTIESILKLLLSQCIIIIIGEFPDY